MLDDEFVGVVAGPDPQPFGVLGDRAVLLLAEFPRGTQSEFTQREFTQADPASAQILGRYSEASQAVRLSVASNRALSAPTSAT